MPAKPRRPHHAECMDRDPEHLYGPCRGRDGRSLPDSSGPHLSDPVFDADRDDAANNAELFGIVLARLFRLALMGLGLAWLIERIFP